MARDRFAHAASITQDGSVEVYEVAKNRAEELNALIRGAGFAGNSANVESVWPQSWDRGPLMERLERAHQDSIEPGLASAAALRASADRVIQEAEIIAAIGSLLSREGMEDAGAAAYAEHCTELQRAAGSVIQAVRRNDYDGARRAGGRISKSCSNCHESYRG